MKGKGGRKGKEREIKGEHYDKREISGAREKKVRENGKKGRGKKKIYRDEPVKM